MTDERLMPDSPPSPEQGPSTAPAETKGPAAAKAEATSKSVSARGKRGKTVAAAEPPAGTSVPASAPVKRSPAGKAAPAAVASPAPAKPATKASRRPKAPSASAAPETKPASPATAAQPIDASKRTTRKVSPPEGGAPKATPPKATKPKASARKAAPVAPLMITHVATPRRASLTRPAASHARSAPRPVTEAHHALVAAPAPEAKPAPVPGPASAPTPTPPRIANEQAESTRPGPIDLEAFAGNLARLVEEGGKAMAAYLRPREEGRVKDDIAEEVADVMKTLGNVAEYWLADPQRAVDAQSRLIGGYLSLWSSTLKRLSGEKVEPVAHPPARDARFVDSEWTSNPFFDALKQTYLLTANWAEKLVDEADIDHHTKHKAEFYVRQIAGAVSPSNFVLTNPELLRATLASNGENLVRGMKMLAEDIEAGDGELKIRQTDHTKFKVGANLATTPGKVIFQNELFQLIQYAPTTETVLKTPVVIIPPWINKFYILDLNAEKSFVRWAVDQGLTVFIVSWVNPSAALADKGFEDYMLDGVLKAIETAKQAAGVKEVHTIGYCVGGTMLAMTLSWLAASKIDAGIRSTTFLTTQVDFSLAGDLQVFIDEDQISVLERRMLESGTMDGKVMANAFNMLRANDLIWPYVVNNYLKGQAPFPFDILYWNSDSTRLPRANHSFYLRNCYLHNKFTKGELSLSGHTLDLSKVTIPIYSLATREDHIAPAVSVFHGLRFFGSQPRFVLAGSGHIAGVVNPPSRGKYQYWTGGKPTGNLEHWIEKAQMHPGSWWPDWLDWLEKHDTERVPARQPGGDAFRPIEDAPGSYVTVKA